MIILLSIILCVRFNHAFGCVSQISFDVEVGSINILESGAVQCGCVVCVVHLSLNLLELAALEGVGHLKVFYFMALKCGQLRNLYIRADITMLPLYFDRLGGLVTDQVESSYFARCDFASLVSAGDVSLIFFNTAAQEEAQFLC